MHATTVRFTEDLWQLVDREATAQGISSAQVVRDAALLRAATLIGQHGDEEQLLDVEAVARGSLRQAGRRAPDANRSSSRQAACRCCCGRA